MSLQPLVLSEADAAQLADVHADAFDADGRWSAAEIAGLLRLETTRAFGLARDGELQAFALMQQVGGDIEVLTVAVMRAAQRQGLAQSLFAQADAYFAAHGGETYLLDVAADNLPALALYRRLGFGQNGRRKAYYHRAGGDAVDAVLMSRLVAGQD